MRRIPALSALAAALAVPALVALGSGPALAAGSAPAPECDSFSTQFTCDAPVSATTVTWTQTIRIDGFTSTSSFSASTILHSGCELHANYTFTYSYVSGGVTLVSPASHFLCNPNAPE